MRFLVTVTIPTSCFCVLCEVVLRTSSELSINIFVVIVNSVFRNRMTDMDIDFGEIKHDDAVVKSDVTIRANAEYVITSVGAVVRFAQWNDMVRFCISSTIRVFDRLST